MENKKVERPKVSVTFLLVTIGTVVVGALGIVISFRYGERTSKIIEAIGEALLIAGVLALTVDRYIKHKLAEEVAHDVARIAFGFHLPPEAEAIFKDITTGWRLFRENLVITWSISRIPSSHLLKVVVHFCFEIRNIGTSEEPYKQSVFVEDHDNPTIEFLRCVKHSPGSKPETLYDYSAEKNNFQIDRTEIGVQKAFGKEIGIKPNANHKGPKYTVVAQYSMKLPEDYSDVFAFGGPTLKVKIISEFPTGLTFVAPDAEVGSNGPWKYDNFYLRNQHLRVRWFKTPAVKGGTPPA